MSPGFTAGKFIIVERLGFHFNAVTGIEWRQVVPVFHLYRIHKVFVQVIDIFDDAVFERRTNRNVIEERKMLHVFTETYAPGVRANRNAKLGRHQDDRQDFVDAGEPAAVDLTKTYCVRLQQLFEDDAVLAGLARSYPDGRDGPGDFRMAQNVV